MPHDLYRKERQVVFKLNKEMKIFGNLNIIIKINKNGEFDN